MRTKYRVKVRHHAGTAFWGWQCEACNRGVIWIGRRVAHAWASGHAARCEALHRANWEAACPSCKLYGRVAKACPICLGYGYEREREGLE